MANYTISDNYLFLKSENKLSITSVDPTDNGIYELEDVAAVMFLRLIESKSTPTEVVSHIEACYQVDRKIIENDLKALIDYLLHEQIIVEI